MGIGETPGMLALLRTITLACCVSLVAARAPLSSEGVIINLSQSPIALSTVWSSGTFDYDFVSGGVGPTYFNDCLYYFVHSKQRIQRIEFMFALSTVGGELRGPSLPVNVAYRNDGKDVGAGRPAACRKYGYEDGAKGLRLVAWVNSVYFRDGTAWHAPTADNLQPIIAAALSRE